MRANNPETIYSAGSGDWTQARLITVSGLARTVPMRQASSKCLGSWHHHKMFIIRQTKFHDLHYLVFFAIIMKDAQNITLFLKTPQCTCSQNANRQTNTDRHFLSISDYGASRRTSHFPSFFCTSLIVPRKSHTCAESLNIAALLTQVINKKSVLMLMRRVTASV